MNLVRQIKIPPTSKGSSTLLRLTIWHVAVLALFTVGLSSIIYALISRNFYDRSDGVLASIEGATIAILHHGLSESGLDELAARDAVRILSFPGYTLAIYDSYGNLLAERPVGTGDSPPIPGGTNRHEGEVDFYTMPVAGSPGDFRRVAVTQSTIQPVGRTYIVVASRSLVSLSAQLKTGRLILLGTVPVGLLLAGLAGWFLVKKSFAPVLAMSERALRISAEDLDQRFEDSGPSNELSQLAGTFNDLLSRLRGSFEVQKRFMADASHELRTPLSIICSAASVTLQLDRPREIEDYRDSLMIIQGEGHRLRRIVEDMLCLARADAGGTVLQRTTFHLDEVLLDTVRSFAHFTSTKGVRVQIESLEEAPATGDEDLLRRIFTNLLSNAIGHTARGGSVFLRLDVEQGSYVIAIRDTGHGIEQEHHQRIFERFYRVNAGHSQVESRDQVMSGAGLGLPIARALAEAHGGSVRLQSSGGDGSTFVCVLPIAAASEPGWLVE